jgi:GT2 family glycosyltransferase
MPESFYLAGKTALMHISIIVPVYNNAPDLRVCLCALRAACGPDAEIIVVDDGSTDDTPLVAAEQEVRLLRLARNSGPAAARNHGARQARGGILFFVDADVIIGPEAVRHVARVFDECPDMAAVFGSYDASPQATGMVSQYRNLLHHFVHQHGNPEASTFWAGCGAIRRAAFEAVGGFDAQRFPQPSIEDIELGYRLRQADYRICLDKALQGTHLKRWTLGSIIRTDVVCRAIPWSRLLLANPNTPNDLNLARGQRLSVALLGLAGALVPLTAWQIELVSAPAAALIGVIALNRRLYAFFARQRGLAFAVVCLPLHWLYYLYSGFSYLYVWIEVHLREAVWHRGRPTSRK